ncbi:MAG: YdcF family protein [Clostridia bacterium]|nr:YdcF family protein [Clostridia bacterium]
MKLFRILCLVVGGFLVLDTIVVCFLSNYNLGVILPAVLGAPLLLLGLFWPWMDAGFWLFLRRAILVCYGLGCLFLLFLGSLMLRAIDRGDHGDYDALIVLGAAVHGDRVTWVLSNRLDAAYDYAAAHPETVLVVSGGQGDGESVTEASAMAGYLTRRGLDPSRILLEDRAESTAENFAFSKAIIDETLGPDASIGFVTTRFHVFRAGAVARKGGIAARGLGAPDVWYIAVNNFLRECVGICWYTLKGWI